MALFKSEKSDAGGAPKRKVGGSNPFWRAKKADALTGIRFFSAKEIRNRVLRINAYGNLKNMSQKYCF